jgi:diguanylate cyclase (GGDEF)-like protein
MSLERRPGVVSPVQGRRELVAHLRARLEDRGEESLLDPREAEYRELAEAYLLLDERMAKLIAISDKYQGELREATKRMQHMARTDPLTNLSNRRDMLDCLDREVERFVRYEKDFSVIMFDIDDFKLVNDSYGHDAGDRVLKDLALVFLETLRRTDVCSRWGGEEFLVLCPETTSESARIVGEKCLMAMSAMQVATEAGPIGITLSGGVAAMQKGFDRDDLIKLADAKLYAAKAAGKKRIVD